MAKAKTPTKREPKKAANNTRAKAASKKTAPKKATPAARGSAGNPRAAKPVEYRIGDRKTWHKADSIRAAAEEIGCNAVGLSKRLASMDKGDEYTYTRLEPPVTVRLAA